MRQKIRKSIILISCLLFPITMWYFSPYHIIMGGFEHIICGSFIVFIAMLFFSIIFGRAWCGYLCPAGGLQECVFRINSNPAKQGKRDLIKYVIWFIWIMVIVFAFVVGKNDVTIDPFYMTDHGVSVANIYNFLIYYMFIFMHVIPAMIHGKRALCHYICWKSPFMVIGSNIGRLLCFPQLHIEADKEKCLSCGKCNRVCPMGLDVKKMVSEDTLAKCSECIECGVCVDECKQGTIKYTFLWNK